MSLTTSILFGGIGGGGAGGIGLTMDHIFESIAARDTYFTANPDELIVTTPIVVNVGTQATPDVRFQVWNGPNQPAAYPSPITNEWVDAGQTQLTVDQITLITSLLNVDPTYIPVKLTSNTFGNSAMRETADSIISDKTIEVPTGSVLFERALRLSSNSQGIDIADTNRNITYESVGARYDPTNGSYGVFDPNMSPLATFNVHLVSDEQSNSFSTIFPTINPVKFERFIVIPRAAGTGTFMVRYLNETGNLLISMFTVDFEAGDVGNETEFMLLSAVNLNAGDSIHVTYTGVPLAGHQYTGDATWGDQFVMYAKTMSYPRNPLRLATESFVNQRLLRNNVISQLIEITSDITINADNLNTYNRKVLYCTAVSGEITVTIAEDLDFDYFDISVVGQAPMRIATQGTNRINGESDIRFTEFEGGRIQRIDQGVFNLIFDNTDPDMQDDYIENARLDGTNLVLENTNDGIADITVDLSSLGGSGGTPVITSVTSVSGTGTVNTSVDLTTGLYVLASTVTGYDFLAGTTLTDNRFFAIQKSGSGAVEFDISATVYTFSNSNLDPNAFNIAGGKTVFFYVKDNVIYALSDIAVLGSAAGDHPLVFIRDTPSNDQLTAIAAASLNGNTGLWITSSDQISTSDDNIDATVQVRAQVAGLLDAAGNEISTTPVAKNTVKLARFSVVRVLSATDLRVVFAPEPTMGVMRYPDIAFSGVVDIEEAPEDEATYNSYVRRTAVNTGGSNQYIELPALDPNHRPSWVVEGDVFVMRHDGTTTGVQRPHFRPDNTSESIAGHGLAYYANPGQTIAIQAPRIGITAWQVFPVSQLSDGGSYYDPEIIVSDWYRDNEDSTAANNIVRLHYKQELADGNVRDHVHTQSSSNNPVSLTFQHRNIQDDIAWIEWFNTLGFPVPPLGSSAAEIIVNVPIALAWIENNIANNSTWQIDDPTLLDSIQYITFISGQTLKVGFQNPLPAHFNVNDVINISGNSFAANNGDWAVTTIYSDRLAVNITIPGSSVANNTGVSGTLARILYATNTLVTDNLRVHNFNLYKNSARNNPVTVFSGEWFDITTNPAPAGSLLNIAYNTDINVTGSYISVQDDAGEWFNIKGGPRGDVSYIDNNGISYQNHLELPVNSDTLHISTSNAATFYIPEVPSQLDAGENRRYTIFSVESNDDDDCKVRVGHQDSTIDSDEGFEQITVLNGTRLTIELYNSGASSGWHIVSAYSRTLAQETMLTTSVLMNSSSANPLPIDIGNILSSQNEDINFDFFDLNTNANEITLRADFIVEAECSLRFYRTGGQDPTGSLSSMFQIMPMVDSGSGFVDQDRFAVPVEVDFNSEVGSTARINFRWIGTDGDRIKFEPRSINIPQGYTESDISVADWRLSRLTAKSRGI